jgi:hypothetical protein
VWQKGAGPRSESNWIMMVELERKKSASDSEFSKAEKVVKPEELSKNGLDEEQKIALQMIEELLNRN